MRIKSIEIENFMGIGKAAIDFDELGPLTLIEGVNHDSPSSESNGAGKSSIFEAILWCLYGVTKRGLKANDVANAYAGKGEACVVTVNFTAAGKPYVVTRSRGGGHGTGAKLAQFDAGGVIDMTKGTDRETNALIEQVAGMSVMTFTKMASFGQGDIKPFAQLTDRELKEVFEQALGLTLFSDGFAKAKGLKAEVEKQIDAIKREIEGLETEKHAVIEKITYLTKAVKDLSERKLAEIQRIRDEITGLNNEKLIISKEWKEAIEKIEAERAVVMPDAEKMKELGGLMAPLATKIEGLKNQKAHADAQAIAAKDSALDAEKKLISVEDDLGRLCRECGRPFTPQDIEARKFALVEMREKALAVYGLHAKNADKIKADIEKLEVLKSGLQRKIDDVAQIVHRFNTTKAKIDGEVSGYQRRAHVIEREIANKEAAIKGIDSDATDYKDQIRAAEIRRQQVVNKVVEHTGKVTGLADRVELASMLCDILGNAGLKSYVFDGVTPELNKLANEYVQALDDIEIEISTVKKLKTGEYREKFSVDAINQHGAPVFAGNSGGEKQKINLAIALAFNRLIRGMAAEPLNVIFLDEPFESLDAGSSEKAVELCKKIADGGVKTLVITHNQAIKDLVSSSIRVEKRGGRATLQIF